MKEWWISFFYFSRKERTGAVIMLIVIACIWLLPLLFRVKKTDLHIVALAESRIAQRQSVHHPALEKSPFSEPFYFDPNTISDSGWLALGIPERVVKTIHKYLSKGGSFKSPNDLSRIYGIKEVDVERLMPFVRMEKIENHKTGSEKKQNSFYALPKTQSITYTKIEKDISRLHTDQIVDINKADTNALIDLPWIGHKLANRIIVFRNLAGGFHSVEQLSDIYGLEDSILLKIKKYLIATGNVRKIQINNITEDSLVKHPYINKSQARSIIQYRQMHGPYVNMEQLKMLHNIDESTLVKLQPYLEF
ncbi:MAG: ComEA family DNA-binding protein [Chitinophagaceae bacterium]